MKVSPSLLGPPLKVFNLNKKPKKSLEARFQRDFFVRNVRSVCIIKKLDVVLLFVVAFGFPIAVLAATQPQPVIEPEEQVVENTTMTVTEPEIPEAIIEPEPEEEVVEELEEEALESKNDLTKESEADIIEPKVEVEPQVEVEPLQGSAANFKQAGVLQDSQYRYTYYSSRVLRHYRTDEWTPGEDGIYRDASGNVVVASSDMALGTEFVSEIFGPCKVYDSGCASGTVDVYVNF